MKDIYIHKNPSIVYAMHNEHGALKLHFILPLNYPDRDLRFCIVQFRSLKTDELHTELTTEGRTQYRETADVVLPEYVTALAGAWNYYVWLENIRDGRRQHIYDGKIIVFRRESKTHE